LKASTKFRISLTIWFLPLLLLLVVNDCESLPQLESPAWGLIPAIETAAGASRYPCAARVAWAYCWVSFPFMLAWLSLCCRDLQLINAESWGGGFSLFMSVLVLILCTYTPFVPYDPEYSGRSWQAIYSRSVLGMVVVTGLLWASAYMFHLSTIQWILWLIRR
jgi:hypothetical protein